MAKPKLNIIQPALGVTQMPDGDLLSRLNAVHDGMLNNPAYPNPPVDLAGFKLFGRLLQELRPMRPNLKAKPNDISRSRSPVNAH